MIHILLIKDENLREEEKNLHQQYASEEHSFYYT